ncbi:MAG: hypothetical protein ACOVRB_01665 [Akkermansiaceae bacterium]
MHTHQPENAEWAKQNGYEYHPGEAEDRLDHVRGTYRNRAFETYDLRTERSSGDDGYSFYWRTIAEIPLEGLRLPNFELLPRRETAGMNFHGVKGLDLHLAPNASSDERAMVDAFKKNYCIFGGGARKALEASIKSARQLVPRLADVASILKPSVLRFLATAVTGSIKVHDGYVTIEAPETRVIRAGISHTILKGSERENLLNIANDFLDVFANSSCESPLRSLALENTFRPTQFLGTFIGVAIGFLIGVIAAIVMFLKYDFEYMHLLPLPIIVGVMLGRFLGNWLTRKI